MIVRLERLLLPPIPRAHRRLPVLGGALLCAIHGATVENTLFEDGDGSNTFRAFEPTQAEEHRYTLDPDHLTVAFLVDHIGYARVLGLFRQAEGSFRFDETSRELRDVRVSVTTDSVWSNQPER